MIRNRRRVRIVENGFAHYIKLETSFMPRSELRFFILFPGGLFAFYGLYQFYSANPTFLRRAFQNRVRNPAEPFAAEIGVPVIGIEITYGQYDPFGIFLPVCKAETDYVR